MEDGRQIYGRKTIVRLHGHMLLRCRIFFIFFRILERRSRPRCSFLSYNSPSANKRRPQYPAARKTSCIEVVVRWNVRQTWTSGVAEVFFRILFFSWSRFVSFFVFFCSCALRIRKARRSSTSNVQPGNIGRKLPALTS
jgi:hypothetical protein